MKRGRNEKWIELDVAGTIFKTRLSTLDCFPDSMLYKMVHGPMDADGITIDMNPVRFGFVLDYMRTGEPPAMSVVDRANFLTDIQYLQLPYAYPLAPELYDLKAIIMKRLMHKYRQCGYKNWQFEVLLDPGNLDTCCQFSVLAKDIIKICQEENVSEPTAPEIKQVLKHLGAVIKNGEVFGVKYICLSHPGWSSNFVHVLRDIYASVDKSSSLISALKTAKVIPELIQVLESTGPDSIWECFGDIPVFMSLDPDCSEACYVFDDDYGCELWPRAFEHNFDFFKSRLEYFGMIEK